MSILYELAEFITTPLFRWLFIVIGIIVTILQYINEPQRFSYKKSFEGLSYKWHLYIIAIFVCITTVLTVIGLWVTIPFTDKLPDYWYVYLFVLYVAIITQITVDSPIYTDDGSFNPPPSYILPQKYRVMIAYVGLIIDIIIMLQIYIYFGIADISKKTILSRYILERYGGWIEGNKLDFLFEWSGLIHVGLKIYVLLLQKNFQACKYGLPPSWNA
jgi:hypothetical protein